MVEQSSGRQHLRFGGRGCSGLRGVGPGEHTGKSSQLLQEVTCRDPPLV